LIEKREAGSEKRRERDFDRIYRINRIEKSSVQEFKDFSIPRAVIKGLLFLRVANS
jgi:hypothetical protein